MTATAGESTGIIVQDEFFNQRGEIITHAADEPPAVSNRLRASLFWMGKEPLRLNKTYKLKLATQEVGAEVESIVKTIDASNLDSREGASEIKLNDVAEVILRLKASIAFDVFQAHQATGRFVLVDGYDVAGGGIVVAAEAAAEEQEPVFIGERVTARGDIFDEFYYDVERYAVTKVAAAPQKTYQVGDVIPTKGLSYEYPADFDILVLRDQAAILVRNRRITAIQPLAEYQYSGNPIVNGRGFGLKVHEAGLLRQLLAEYAALTAGQASPKEKADFANRYYFLNQYRTLKFYFDYVI